MNTEAEIWARCPSYADYEASSWGRVRRWRGGRVDGEPIILSQHAEKSGYMKLRVQTGASGEPKAEDVWKHRTGSRDIRAHTLVADAFLGPCPKGHEVNHKDLNKANNAPGNLEYVTHRENLEHAIRLRGNWLKGRPCFWKGKAMPVAMREKMSMAKRGARHPRAKTVDPDAIKRLYAEGKTQQDIAAGLGVSRTCVGDVLRGTHWTVGGYRTNSKTI